MRALADRFLAAIEAGDTAAVEAMYAPDAAIWHNHDQKIESRERNVKTLAFMAATLSNRRYHVHRRDFTADGFIQEHTLTGTLPDGTAFSLPAAVFVTVKDGKIATLREYLDGPTATAPFVPFLPARRSRDG